MPSATPPLGFDVASSARFISYWDVIFCAAVRHWISQRGCRRISSWYLRSMNVSDAQSEVAQRLRLLYDFI